MVAPETSAAEWLRRAHTDLQVAQVLLRDGKVPAWPVGFHLQQAAEKALKAALVHAGRTPPRTHDLQYLVTAAAALAPSLSPWADHLLGLDDFSVAQRYPSMDEPSLDIDQAYARVMALLEEVERVCRS